MLLKLFGFATICKWVGRKSKWKQPEKQKTQEIKKYLKIEYGLNEWFLLWNGILRWFKFLKLFQRFFCVQASVTLPIGICTSPSTSWWGYGFFGAGTFVTYLIYYFYFAKSQKLLKYQSKVKESLHLQKCKSTVKWALLINLFPLVSIFRYKPFESINYSLSDLVDTVTLEHMNPVLFAKKLTKLNKKPEELQGLSVDLEEFQQPIDLI